jgi:hypothetical protein
VHNGIELSGIDIQYRAERGRRVSGKVIGATVAGGGLTVHLKHAVTGDVILSEWDNTRSRGPEVIFGFELRGIADGEYDLVAERYLDDDGGISPPRRVKVEGADVTGVELRLSPLASVTGTLRLEENKAAKDATGASCSGIRQSSLEETAMMLIPDETVSRQPAASAQPPKSQNAFPARTGEFTVKYLSAGRYRFAPQLPSEDWHVRAITLPNAQTRASIDLARRGVALGTGERLKGVVVAVSTGAASLHGKLQPKANTKLPANVRVHLVPAEKDSADDVLRYAEVKTASDGAFALANLAPGKYWIVTRLVDEASSQAPRRAAWDAAEREKLRKEAEAANALIELQACQRVKDYALKL